MISIKYYYKVLKFFSCLSCQDSVGLKDSIIRQHYCSYGQIRFSFLSLDSPLPSPTEFTSYFLFKTGRLLAPLYPNREECMLWSKGPFPLVLWLFQSQFHAFPLQKNSFKPCIHTSSNMMQQSIQISLNFQ